MKNLSPVAAFMLCLIFVPSSSPAQNGWAKDTIHIQTIGNLWDVKFSSRWAGVLVGDSAKRSTDGGRTWLPLSPAIGFNGIENQFAAVHCFDSTTWAALGATPFRTTNAGQTWTFDSLLLANAIVRSVDFTGPVGIAVGTYGVMLKSIDSGIDWSVLPYTPGPSQLNYFGVAPAGDAWIVVGGDNLSPTNKGVILRSTDGGSTWNPVRYSPARVVTAVSFATSSIGYAAGDSIYRTTDGGATWKGMAPIPVSVSGLSFKDSSVGTLVGSGGAVYRTRNGGATWIQQLSNTNLDLRAVCFIDTSIGWAVGYRGIVLRTTNGGWGVPSAVGDGSGEIPEAFALLQNYPNPFNPTTTIRYALAAPSDVQLAVYDMLGREVSTLVSERKEAGAYDVPFDASGLASGLYFYRLKAGAFVETRKLLLLR